MTDAIAHWQDHDASKLGSKTWLYCFRSKLDVDRAPEGVDGMCEMKTFYAFRQLLSDAAMVSSGATRKSIRDCLPMNNQNQVSDLRSFFFGGTSLTCSC